MDVTFYKQKDGFVLKEEGKAIGWVIPNGELYMWKTKTAVSTGHCCSDKAKASLLKHVKK